MARFEALLGRRGPRPGPGRGTARRPGPGARWRCGGASRWRTSASELLSSREVPRLAELRLQALEARIDADLHLGCHAEVIAELRRLAASTRCASGCTRC